MRPTCWRRCTFWLDYPAEPTGLLDAQSDLPSNVGIDNIEYDAKGQRTQISYKNGDNDTIPVRSRDAAA